MNPAERDAFYDSVFKMSSLVQGMAWRRIGATTCNIHFSNLKAVLHLHISVFMNQ